MKTTNLTIEIEEKYQALFEKGIAAIETYKADGDIKKFQKALCELVDETPNVCYLDPDVLTCYGLEDYEESQWVECDEAETDEYNTNVKDIILTADSFADYQLGFGSASILITIWGDTFYKLFKR